MKYRKYTEPLAVVEEKESKRGPAKKMKFAQTDVSILRRF